MTEFPPPDIRIGDTEREQAIKALGEHMSAGRLDLEEYGERSARTTAAKTRGELLALFTDLPEPRPTFGAPVPLFEPVAKVADRRWTGAAVPLVGLAAVVLFFVVKNPLVLVIIPVAALLLGALANRRR